MVNRCLNLLSDHSSPPVNDNVVQDEIKESWDVPRPLEVNHSNDFTDLQPLEVELPAEPSSIVTGSATTPTTADETQANIIELTTTEVFSGTKIVLFDATNNNNYTKTSLFFLQICSQLCSFQSNFSLRRYINIFPVIDSYFNSLMSFFFMFF